MQNFWKLQKFVFILVLWPVETLLGGSIFHAKGTGMLGFPDFVLCTTEMPVEIKTRHNSRLGNRTLWQVYRYADRAQIKGPLSQAFSEMDCNGLHYDILTNYSDTYD
jgi:hypothetical protein